MSKKQSKRNRAKAALARMPRSKAALAGALVALPMMATAPGAIQSARAQMGRESSAPSVSEGVMHLKYKDAWDKIAARFTIVGMDDGHTVYRKANGEYFWIDPATGDFNSIASAIYMKYAYMKQGMNMGAIKFSNQWIKDKQASNVKILGVDAAGHVIQQCASGQHFYLNPMTGDLVYVK
jgi:hypothetical protein